MIIRVPKVKVPCLILPSAWPHFRLVKTDFLRMACLGSRLPQYGFCHISCKALSSGFVWEGGRIADGQLRCQCLPYPPEFDLFIGK